MMESTSGPMETSAEPDTPEMFEEMLQHCQYAEGSNNIQGFEQCSDPASYRISWDRQKTWLYLCLKHYRKVSDQEHGST